MPRKGERGGFITPRVIGPAASATHQGTGRKGSAARVRAGGREEPPPAERIDQVCSYCGKVMEGPHKGERVPKDQIRRAQYKGTEISHGGPCPDCYQGFMERYRRGE